MKAHELAAILLRPEHADREVVVDHAFCEPVLTTAHIHPMDGSREHVLFDEKLHRELTAAHAHLTAPERDMQAEYDEYQKSLAEFREQDPQYYELVKQGMPKIDNLDEFKQVDDEQKVKIGAALANMAMAREVLVLGSPARAVSGMDDEAMSQMFQTLLWASATDTVQ